MKTLKVGIAGATGYTGIELLRILLNHPNVEVVLATSEKFAGKKVADLFPYFAGKTSLVLEELNDGEIAKRCDVAFSCLPHHSAAEHVASWVKAGLKAVDLSADFRLQSVDSYKEWYGDHAAPGLLKDAVYGLCETHRDKIKKAKLVANPGCYPTGTILALTPFLKEKKIDPDSIVVDAKSGVSGAGRSAVLESLFSEVNESVHAYKVGKHRHTPEIEQELSRAAGRPVVISFTPHLIPMDRGILSTIYAKAVGKTSTQETLAVLSSFYKDEPFVRILPEGSLPKTKNVRGSNVCEIGAHFDSRTGRIVLIAAIDNLMKGAASQAVQNLNLLSGWDEKTGLSLPAWAP
ncbi:MAG TPA: N-acetyl-gamma-glutamyl-phosphate reductase [bacterium]|nr:N-acetyl-gamma-glutamyl-phosphate reductase [bacterium]